jgi:hypothetical protein
LETGTPGTSIILHHPADSCDLSDRHFPVRITPGASVNGLPFSVSPDAVLLSLGDPDEVRLTESGEVEYVFSLDERHAVIYRCQDQRLVECTFPDYGPIVMNGLPILSAKPWIAAQADALHIARFWISPAHCIAYDDRDPANGSFTVYRRGHWDQLLAQARRL